MVKKERPAIGTIDESLVTMDTLSNVVEKTSETGVFTSTAVRLLAQATALRDVRTYWRASDWDGVLDRVAEAKMLLDPEATDNEKLLAERGMTEDVVNERRGSVGPNQGLGMVAAEMDLALAEAVDHKLQVDLLEAISTGHMTGEPGWADLRPVSTERLHELIGSQPTADRTSVPSKRLLRTANVVLKVREFQKQDQYREVLEFLKPLSGTTSDQWDLAGLSGLEPEKVHESAIDELLLARGDAINRVVNVDLRDTLLKSSVSGVPGTLRLASLDTSDLASSISFAEEVAQDMHIGAETASGGGAAADDKLASSSSEAHSPAASVRRVIGVARTMQKLRDALVKAGTPLVKKTSEEVSARARQKWKKAANAVAATAAAAQIMREQREDDRNSSADETNRRKSSVMSSMTSGSSEKKKGPPVWMELQMILKEFEHEYQIDLNDRDALRTGGIRISIGAQAEAEAKLKADEKDEAEAGVAVEGAEANAEGTGPPAEGDEAAAEEEKSIAAAAASPPPAAAQQISLPIIGHVAEELNLIHLEVLYQSSVGKLSSALERGAAPRWANERGTECDMSIVEIDELKANLEQAQAVEAQIRMHMSERDGLVSASSTPTRVGLDASPIDLLEEGSDDDEGGSPSPSRQRGAFSRQDSMESVESVYTYDPEDERRRADSVNSSRSEQNGTRSMSAVIDRESLAAMGGLGRTNSMASLRGGARTRSNSVVPPPSLLASTIYVAGVILDIRTAIKEDDWDRASNALALAEKRRISDTVPNLASNLVSELRWSIDGVNRKIFMKQCRAALAEGKPAGTIGDVYMKDLDVEPLQRAANLYSSTKVTGGLTERTYNTAKLVEGLRKSIKADNWSSVRELIAACREAETKTPKTHKLLDEAVDEVEFASNEAEHRAARDVIFRGLLDGKLSGEIGAIHVQSVDVKGIKEARACFARLSPAAVTKRLSTLDKTARCLIELRNGFILNNVAQLHRGLDEWDELLSQAHELVTKAVQSKDRAMMSALEEFKLARSHMRLIDIVESLRIAVTHGGLGNGQMKEVPVGELDRNLLEVDELRTAIKEAHDFLGVEGTVGGDLEDLLQSFPPVLASVYRAAKLILDLRQGLISNDWDAVEIIGVQARTYIQRGIKLPEQTCAREIRRSEIELENSRLVEALQNAMVTGAASGSVGSIDLSGMRVDLLVEAIDRAKEISSMHRSKEAKVLLDEAKVLLKIRRSLQELVGGVAAGEAVAKSGDGSAANRGSDAPLEAGDVVIIVRDLNGTKPATYGQKAFVIDPMFRDEVKVRVDSGELEGTNELYAAEFLLRWPVPDEQALAPDLPHPEAYYRRSRRSDDVHNKADALATKRRQSAVSDALSDVFIVRDKWDHVEKALYELPLNEAGVPGVGNEIVQAELALVTAEAHNVKLLAALKEAICWGGAHIDAVDDNFDLLEGDGDLGEVVVEILREELRNLTSQKDAGKMGEGVLATLDGLFEEFDKDGSGELDRREFQKGLEKIGVFLNGRDLSLVMKKFDTDGDGLVTMSEFMKFVEDKSEELMPEVEAELAAGAAKGDKQGGVSAEKANRGLVTTHTQSLEVPDEHEEAVEADPFDVSRVDTRKLESAITLAQQLDDEKKTAEVHQLLHTAKVSRGRGVCAQAANYLQPFECARERLKVTTLLLRTHYSLQ